MFILCILSLIIAEKVQIISGVNKNYILSILAPTEGNYVRMMKESIIKNPVNQRVFEINGDRTVLDNNGVLICNNGLDRDVVSCLRNSIKKTIFNVIRNGSEVIFRTDNNRCLSIDVLDDFMDAFTLKLNDCREGDGRQKFILASFPESGIPNAPPASNPNIINDVTPFTPLPNEIKGITPPAPFPNEIKGVTPTLPSPYVIDNNTQKSNSNACSNLVSFNNGFIPATCNSNNIPILTETTQFNGYLNPTCFDTNQSGGSASSISAYKFRRPAQPNDCNNHQMWSGTFRRSY